MINNLDNFNLGIVLTTIKKFCLDLRIWRQDKNIKKMALISHAILFAMLRKKKRNKNRFLSTYHMWKTYM